MRPSSPKYDERTFFYTTPQVAVPRSAKPASPWHTLAQKSAEQQQQQPPQVDPGNVQAERGVLGKHKLPGEGGLQWVSKSLLCFTLVAVSGSLAQSKPEGRA